MSAAQTTAAYWRAVETSERRAAAAANDNPTEDTDLILVSGLGAFPRTPSPIEEMASLPGYVYVGTAYSKHKRGLAAANAVACRACASLMRQGVRAFSPIAHSHAVSFIGSVDGRDWEFWKRQDQPMMDAAAALCVVTMDGWRDSVGLTYEIAEFEDAGKPVFYLSPAELGVVS